MINEMNLDEDSGLTVSCGNGKLRQWLIDQIDSRLYGGLVWENEEKSIFRIPWKHAGKQDYNRDEDAALFKAWALIIPEAAKRGMKMSMEETPSHANSHGYVPPYTSPQNQVSGYMVSQERRDWRDYSPPEQQPLPPPHHHGPHAELQYGSSHYPSAFSRAWPGSHTENGFQLSFHTYLSESQLPVYSFDQSNAITDFSLHVSLYYRESMRQRKMITAQVEPVFAKKLVHYYQQNNGHYLRAFDHIQEQNTSLTVDYPS
ncbi:hypothetical protein CgunFtcFv8_023489 [Champsocephalus gunnari]|uniref:IRF tryptophan pentad repeat domain-containing protein n=1 Tax=Champsocephalus gunnari TaxID=52237 RepID=A0AAN8HLG3_CHAGU|nr:hypothetical protein CgunFtcFv8_023489 [Champsocephalus gunnari]